MNKRIRELEKEAISIVLNGDDQYQDVDKMYIPHEYSVKFAELLIQEYKHTHDSPKQLKFNCLKDEIEGFIAEHDTLNPHYLTDESIINWFGNHKKKHVKRALKELR